MAEVSQNILNKIAKLLATADTKRGATENEALIAAAMAQDLLQKHGLSIAEIEASGGKSSDEGAAREKKTVKGAAMYKWQRELMETLAKTNFCMHSIVNVFDDETKRYGKRHQIIGRVVNVQGTKIMYDYLVSTMRRLVKEAGHAPGTHNEKDYHYWLEGCATRLGQRLEEKAEEARVESERKEREAKAAASHPSAAPRGTALVLANVYQTEEELNEDVRDGLPLGTTTARRLKWDADQRAKKELLEKLIAEGVDPDVASYISWGYTRERAEEIVARQRREAEEEAAKPKRLGRAPRPRKGRTYTWTKADEKRAEKLNSSSYQAGSQAGEKIGLDPQVSHQAKKRIG